MIVRKRGASQPFSARKRDGQRISHGQRDRRTIRRRGHFFPRFFALSFLCARATIDPCVCDARERAVPFTDEGDEWAVPRGEVREERDDFGRSARVGEREDHVPVRSDESEIAVQGFGRVEEYRGRAEAEESRC